MFEIAAWGSGLAAGAYLLFLVYLGLAWRGGAAGAALIVAVAGSVLWGLAKSYYFLAPSAVSLQLAIVVEVLRGAGWFSFLAILIVPLLGGGGGGVRRWPYFATAAVLAGQLCALGLALVVPEWMGDPVRAVLAVLLAGVVFGLVLVEQLFRNVPVESRWGLKPLCLALAAGYVFDLYFFADGFLFGRPDSDIWAARGFVATVLIPLIALSAARSPSWTVKISVSREVVFHSTALALSGVYLLVIAAAGYYVRYFGGDWGRALQVALMSAGLLLLGVFVFSGTQRARLRVFVNKNLFPYRYDYRTEWLRFTQALSSADDSMNLGQSVIKALSDLVESSGGLLWLRDGSGMLLPHARLNHPAIDIEESVESDFCRFLDEREWIVNLEELRMGGRTRFGDLPLPEWLSRLPDAWLVVPLKSGSTMVGFVVLNSARTRFEVNWEVLDLLKTAQRQAASYLARMQAAEALIESRKFDSFNRMSAFVVHDLKNLVAQLSLMLKNAERHRDNPEFQQDMLDTVVHVEAKMRSLMQQLQEKKSVEPTRKIDLGTLLEGINASKRHQGGGLELMLPHGDRIEVVAHADRLQRVIGHVVQNALDATAEGGKVSVRLDRSEAGCVSVVVTDTGCGMTQEFIRDRLFKPFQTSKSSGMGIGMFETMQYIRELGGSLRVESTPDIGTTVTMILPRAGRSGQDQAAEAEVEKPETQ